MKVGFFGGSFDPIHFGHLSLAIQLAEIEGLDEVVFSPVWCSPFKEASPPEASAEDRLEMVKLSIERIPSFRVTDYEIKRETPSYTIDVIRHFHKASPASFYLLLSEESALHLPKWKETPELMTLAPPLIGARSLSSSIPSALKDRFRKISVLEISSTEIRKRLKEELYCGHLLPEKVLSYIHKQGLYKK